MRLTALILAAAIALGLSAPAHAQQGDAWKTAAALKRGFAVFLLVIGAWMLYHR